MFSKRILLFEIKFLQGADAGWRLHNFYGTVNRVVISWYASLVIWNHELRPKLCNLLDAGHYFLATATTLWNRDLMKHASTIKTMSGRDRWVFLGQYVLKAIYDHFQLIIH